MKIFVCSKKEMRSQYYTNKNWYNDPNKYFISIAGLADGCEYPCPFLAKDSKRVLHLLFSIIFFYILLIISILVHFLCLF